MAYTQRLVVLAALLAASLPASAQPPARRPWWDDFPTIVQTDDAARAKRSNANAALTGTADDQAWGIWGQRLRVAESGPKTSGAMHRLGLKALSYTEGYGNAVAFVVQLKRSADGSWAKLPGTDVTQTLTNHWGWHTFDGTGEVRWVGLHAYWNDEDYARPYTLTHPRYGAPPARYPDGRLATGYNGSPTDPRSSRVFDATCARNVLGRMFGGTAGRPLISDVLRGEKATAPTEEQARNLPAVVPDPGYTPAQWAERTRKSGALTILEADKDACCPHWNDYHRAEIRMALDNGVDGIWIDNFSPWDSFNASPIHHAFGEWSVARFRDHLRARFSAAELKTMGVADLAGFDVRAYLQDRIRAWGGNPQDLQDARWSDARWQDDPVWRAYLIHRRVTGTEALSALYRVYKDEARKAGKPDFLVMGNDIPAFSLGWARGDLDMVSTELTWGWWLATGPRGIMPPPLGCYAPVYKLAREHAKSRLVNAWMYSADNVKGKPHIGDVVSYQALANHALPMPQYGDHTMGPEESNAAFFKFVRSVAPAFGGRMPIEQVGVYYSSSSLLVDMLPGGYRDHAKQAHSFSFWGWTTALTWLHAPWRALPEWKLKPAELKGLRTVIIPSAEVFPAEDARTLAAWVRAGGQLIVAGQCGLRQGEAGNFERVNHGSTLALLTGAPKSDQAVIRLGKGTVLVAADDPGYAFFQADKKRPEMLPAFAKLLAQAGAAPDKLALSAPSVSWKVGLTPYAEKGRLLVDVNNTDIDIDADHITPAPATQFTVRLPKELQGKRLRARVLSPQAARPTVSLTRQGADRATVTLGPIELYASVIIEAAN